MHETLRTRIQRTCVHSLFAFSTISCHWSGVAEIHLWKVNMLGPIYPTKSVIIMMYILLSMYWWRQGPWHQKLWYLPNSPGLIIPASAWQMSIQRGSIITQSIFCNIPTRHFVARESEVNGALLRFPGSKYNFCSTPFVTVRSTYCLRLQWNL